MKTIMAILGYILLIPIVLIEGIVKVIWSIIFSIFKPLFIFMNDGPYWKLYDYAYKFKGNFPFTNFILGLWA